MPADQPSRSPNQSRIQTGLATRCKDEVAFRTGFADSATLHSPRPARRGELLIPLTPRVELDEPDPLVVLRAGRFANSGIQRNTVDRSNGTLTSPPELGETVLAHSSGSSIVRLALATRVQRREHPRVIALDFTRFASRVVQKMAPQLSRLLDHEGMHHLPQFGLLVDEDRFRLIVPASDCPLLGS